MGTKADEEVKRAPQAAELGRSSRGELAPLGRLRKRAAKVYRSLAPLKARLSAASSTTFSSFNS
jgi:hypothetical protein